jgi:DNA-binding MarR family transcriptional regulator
MNGIHAYYVQPMTAPLADRVLQVLGDGTTRGVLRRLMTAPADQGELASKLSCNQSTASRAIATLRGLGLIEELGRGRSTTLQIVARAELIAVLLAADRLAEVLIEREAEMQADLSAETRRLAVRPADDPPAAEHDS